MYTVQYTQYDVYYLRTADRRQTVVSDPFFRKAENQSLFISICFQKSISILYIIK